MMATIVKWMKGGIIPFYNKTEQRRTSREWQNPKKNDRFLLEILGRHGQKYHKTSSIRKLWKNKRSGITVKDKKWYNWLAFSQSQWFTLVPGSSLSPWPVLQVPRLLLELFWELCGWLLFETHPTFAAHL